MSLLTGMFKTKILLLRNGKSQNSYMLPEVKGKIFHVSPMTVMLAMGFTWMALLCHDNFPQI